jgi:hypothetical protein
MRPHSPKQQQTIPIMTTLKSFALFLFLVTSAHAQTSVLPEVHVKLTLGEPKSIYKIGEPIRLILVFTADREGYVAEVLPDRKEYSTDTIVISPEIGVSNWLVELTDGFRYLRDISSTANLSNAPQRVELILNDTLRFDNPGRYTVSVTTRRVTKNSLLYSRPLTLTTNSITFEVEPMSVADETAEVKRLSDLLAAKRNWQTEEEVGKLLSFLTGEPSTREKVRQFLNLDERRGNLNSHLWYGLFIASNRQLVLKLLEAGLRDPNTEVNTQLLHAVTRLRRLVADGIRMDKPGGVSSMLSPEEDPRAREIRDAYIVELSAGLAKRKDQALTTTAITIASNPPKDPQAANVGSREARRILIQQFDALPPSSQEWLMRQDWEELRDRSMTPVYNRALSTGPGPGQKGIHEASLKLLIEIATDEARPFVVAEIRDQNSFVDVKLLGSIEAKSLPEADASLLEQIRRLAYLPNNAGFVHMKQKTSLLVRFGSAGIYQELMELYQAVGSKLYQDGRAGLLAYFAKHNEREAIPLIEQAITELKPDEDPAVLRELTALYYSDAIGVLVKKLLATDDLAPASTAAYLIGLHGSPDDQKVLEARLKRWQEEWGNRVAEADEQHQGRIERELVWALTHGKSWKLSPERLRELQMGCITQMCKQSNSIQ